MIDVLTDDPEWSAWSLTQLHHRAQLMPLAINPAGVVPPAADAMVAGAGDDDASLRHTGPERHQAGLRRLERQRESGAAAIARLRIGDALRYVADDRCIRLDDDSGITIGRLAKDFQVPPGLQCVAARVHAIFIWRRLDNKPGYREQCRSDVWEVVQPELVFAHEK